MTVGDINRIHEMMVIYIYIYAYGRKIASYDYKPVSLDKWDRIGWWYFD